MEILLCRPTTIEDWFKQKGWTPFPFQREAWRARLNGESGLIHVPTGAGKTYAAVLGALAFAAKQTSGQLNSQLKSCLRIVYVSPLKAVARDIQLALEAAVAGLNLPFRVEARTGDTSSHRRLQQRARMPEILVTTPESLALLLCDNDHERHFANLETVIIDEWHECIGNKRGSLLELTLSRLRTLRPQLSTWALSATISNTAEAAQVAVGAHRQPHIVRASLPRPVEIESMIPPDIDTFPWSGHLGLRLAPALAKWLDPNRPTLIFTNTRAQAERWFQALVECLPEWAEFMALHHGSLDHKERARVEAGLKCGSLRFVVATSSLDLGVDFAPVDRVVQIGSPKGVARLLQRAGRSAHRPGEAARVLFVPTHALELLEIAAVREAVARGEVEPRHPLPKPLDVLVQHLVTRALGGGFTRQEIRREISLAVSYNSLTEEELDWALEFACGGGYSLQAYPSFRRVELDYGVYRVRDPRIARLHRMNIGTIVSEASVALKLLRGKQIGFIEEGFVAKLRKGDRFLFSGRVLTYVGMQNMEARVRLGTGSATVSPSWSGGRLPYSDALSKELRRFVAKLASPGEKSEVAEMRAIEPILAAQRRLSALPRENETLIEISKTREGRHLFIYPFEGRLIHEGLAAIVAIRLSRAGPGTFSLTVNDYGFEVFTTEAISFSDLFSSALFSAEGYEVDLRSAMDLTQLARQRFREIARVAGLLHPGHPGARKNVRQLQVSAGLLFDVFKRYEPDQLLVKQAENQVLAEQTETVDNHSRLQSALMRIQNSTLVVKEVSRPTPLGFPLLVERLSARLSSESVEQRIAKMKQSWSTR